jgi:hypothetical protein
MVKEITLVKKIEQDGTWYYVRSGYLCLVATQDYDRAVSIYDNALHNGGEVEQILKQDLIVCNNG